MARSRRWIGVLGGLLLAGCTAQPAPVPVAAPPLAGGEAVILAVRKLPDGPVDTPVLAALQLSRTSPAPSPPDAGPAVEVTLRTDDGRVLTLVQRPPGGLRANLHVHLLNGPGLVSIGS